MLRSLLLPVLFFTLSATVLAQAPRLIADFTPGSDGSVDDFNYQGIVYNESILMPLSTPDAGLELAMIKDENITILRDINVGADGSAPRYFTEFNGRVYFQATDGIGGIGLWVTDGTEAGTQEVFAAANASSGISRLVISASNNMYFSYEDVLYRTADGVTFQTIKNGASIFFSGRQASPAYTTYEDEIAYLYQDDTTWELYVVEGDTAVFKGSVESTSRFSEAFGLSDLDGALMFSTESSFDQDFEANHIYRPGRPRIEEFDIVGRRAARINPLETKAALCWVIGSGFFNVTGTGPSAEPVDANSGSYTQGSTMKEVVFDDKYVFVSSGGVFGDDFLVFSDGTEAGSRRVKELVSQQSEFVSAGKYAVIGEGVSNGFDPELTLVDMQFGTASTIYSFAPLRSLEIRSVRPIAILGNTVYFANKLDETVGAEIFAIDFVVSSLRETTIESALDLRLRDGQYYLDAEVPSSAQVSFVNAAGAIVEVQNVQTNTWNFAPSSTGVLFLAVQTDEGVKTFKVVQPW